MGLRLMVMGVCLLGMCAVVAAQPDDTETVAQVLPDAPLTLGLAGDGRFAEAVFDGTAGQVVTLAAQADDPAALDLVLELVAPDGERVAYNDDWAGGREVRVPDGLNDPAPSDSALIRLILPETGAYRARVNTFNGEGVGTLALRLTVESVPTLALGGTAIVGLHRAEIRPIDLALAAGQTVTLTLRDPRGWRDPYLVVLDPTGQPVAVNDDHATPDLALSLFDSRLTLTAPTDGVYRVLVREFLGRTGDLTLDAALVTNRP